MKNKKFLRRNWDKYKRLGRKKKLKWRKSRGIHAKIRKQRKGYPGRPEIGMKKPRKEQKKISFVRNISDLMLLKNGEAAMIRRMAKRKRIEIEKKAEEIGIKILNLGLKKSDDFLAH